MDYSHQARGESWNILLVCVSYLYFVNVYKIYSYGSIYETSNLINFISARCKHAKLMRVY